MVFGKVPGVTESSEDPNRMDGRVACHCSLPVPLALLSRAALPAEHIRKGASLSSGAAEPKVIKVSACLTPQHSLYVLAEIPRQVSLRPQ